MKRITINISDRMYQEIQSYIGELSITKNGVIWILIEHGLNYEWKKKTKKIRETLKNQQQTAKQSTVDQDQKYNGKTKEELQEIAATKWANGETNY